MAKASFEIEIPVRATDIKLCKARLEGDIAQMIRDLPAERHLLADLLSSLRAMDHIVPTIDEPKSASVAPAANDTGSAA
jgi:hypothetical protein